MQDSNNYNYFELLVNNVVVITRDNNVYMVVDNHYLMPLSGETARFLTEEDFIPINGNYLPFNLKHTTDSSLDIIKLFIADPIYKRLDKAFYHPEEADINIDLKLISENDMSLVVNLLKARGKDYDQDLGFLIVVKNEDAGLLDLNLYLRDGSSINVTNIPSKDYDFAALTSGVRYQANELITITMEEELKKAV